jgi:hypothetical protein
MAAQIDRAAARFEELFGGERRRLWRLAYRLTGNGALFGRAFGTFTPSDRAFHVEYGLDDFAPERARSLPALLRWPGAARAREPAHLGRSE